ncbi:MAG: aminotransferase class V-fold PLP-dependent enzyme, partial [Verrucomicrobia bacterium]|nr:aminotransferase class V-fold PLP-dependent enzyme [Verrucomicrobiota bacterium]
TKPGQTALVSVMWANNETGVMAPMDEIAQIAHERGAMFHTDAVQLVGKEKLSVKNTPVDYLSLSGHKFHAPKGIGALFISRRVRFQPWALGGGQEFGRRSGTEAIPNIVALGMAAEIARQEIDGGGAAKIGAMRNAFEERLMAAHPDTLVNGDRMNRLSAISSLCFPGVDTAGLIILLDERGLACSAGSACHTGDLQSSHVLMAMGFDDARIRSTMRFSWSRMNTMEETLKAADIVIACVNKMRSLQTGLVRQN